MERSPFGALRSGQRRRTRKVRSDEGKADQLVLFAFDLLLPNGESTAQLPLIQHKERPYAPGDRGIQVKPNCLNREGACGRGLDRSGGKPVRTSARCCWATTPRTSGCTMQGAPAPASPTRDSNGWRACLPRCACCYGRSPAKRSAKTSAARRQTDAARAAEQRQRQGLPMFT